jgi:hypothetical protein
VNLISSIQDRIDQIEASLSGLKADVAAETAAAAQAPSGGLDLSQHPEVARAAQAFAQAVAKASGVDLPVGGTLNGGLPQGILPVLELPREFGAAGGIGIGVMLAKPQG